MSHVITLLFGMLLGGTLSWLVAINAFARVLADLVERWQDLGHLVDTEAAKLDEELRKLNDN